MTRISETELSGVFGSDSMGLTPEERAATSKQQFVRSQDHLAFDSPTATGKRYTASRALELYGYAVLQEAWEKGSAVLVASLEEPARSLRERRVALGMTLENLAKKSGLTLETVCHAEDATRRSSIHDLERLAQVLGLDPDLLGFSPGALASKK